MKILMVCLGNFCRSPLAEGIMRKKIEEAGLDWQVDSAGTFGYHVGSAPHELSQKVAFKNGIDISMQVCRKFTANDFLAFDRIYVMDKNNYSDVLDIDIHNEFSEKVSLLMNELFPGENLEVPDPYYGSEKGYHEVFDMIGQACEAVIVNHSKEKINE